MNIKIIVATHKKNDVPNNDIYFPIHVGRLGKEDIGYTGDDSGENISDKNPCFCELTGLYWAWKNLECDYLGLVHYRRYFTAKPKRQQKSLNVMDAVLGREELERFLQRYDVLVPQKRKYYIETLYSHYEHTHYKEHLDITREIIQELCPAYVAAFDKVMKQRSGYMFNMYVMKKELSDAYCQWLFPILFELEKRMASQQYSFYQGRFCGRVSEIIFNVWLLHEKLTCCEVPYMHTEGVDWWKKGTAFLKAKFRHKKYQDSY